MQRVGIGKRVGRSSRRSAFFETPTSATLSSLLEGANVLAGCSERPLSSRSQTAASAWKEFFDQRQDLGQRFIEIAAGGERAGQAIERGGAFFAAAFRLFALAQLCGEMTDDERDHEIGAEHHEVVKVRDVKGEARRNEEKIPEQRAERGEKKRRPPAQPCGGENDREQIEKRNGPVASVIEDRQRQGGHDGGDGKCDAKVAPGRAGQTFLDCFTCAAAPIRPPGSCGCRCCRCGA